jgi:preprotein translocase subunit SecG
VVVATRGKDSLGEFPEMTAPRGGLQRRPRTIRRIRSSFFASFFVCVESISVLLSLYMVTFTHILPYVQILLSALLIVSIIMQRTGASLGGAFGVDNFSSGFHTRRGLERTLFYTSIVIGILFALSALISLLIN